MVGISTRIPHRRENSSMAQLSYFLEGIRDLIYPCLTYPCLTGEPEKRPERGESICEVDAELAEEVKKMLLVRMGQAESRSETVDRKLLSLFRITSLLATLAIAIFIGAANLTGINSDVPTYLIWFSVLTILYEFIQMFRAATATLQGLRASGYERLGQNILIPKDSDTINIYNQRQIPNLMYIIEQNEWVINRKVDSMEIAYTAIRNALWSLLVLMSLALLLAFNILT